MFPFSCACADACVCAATSENEIPLRHNTSTRMFTTRGCVWSLKNTGSGLPRAPKPDDFVCTCVYVELRFYYRVIPIACVCVLVLALVLALVLELALVLALVLVLVLKTRL